MDYSKTVNLLQTAFPMKADLPVREPLMLAMWEQTKLYSKIQQKGKGKKMFLLHDGPPYANGDIHIGHALNKILKDVVVKYKTLQGFQSPYKPGWDCHGLPIEHALFKQLGKSKHQVPRSEIRAKAAEYAMNWVNKQKEDFKRLGVLGDWENPYLTLSHDYEAATVETFFNLRNAGAVYKGLKPGYWCAYDETALAEAEVEYAEKTSDSVYVRFLLKDGLPKQNVKGDVFVLIWTTTPWTLPANSGLAFHPEENYVLLSAAGANYIVADKLSEKVQKILEKKAGSVQKLDVKFKGKELLGAKAINPLHGRESRVVNASYVTMEDGTGIVHIAPGHGIEDFAVGQEYKLDVLSPVDERGKFDATVGREDLVGKHVLKDANAAVMQALGENLIFHHTFQHSYPHCWRCKNPIIFRATEQWFLRVDDAFRKKLVGEIDRVKWEPAYGVHRIKGMVETRPDWCLSRQRYWGAPIAVLYCAKKECRTALNDAAVNQRIVELIAKSGGTAWYETPAEELVGKTKCSKCSGTQFEKESDILDVWFDSGVSWHAVVEREFADRKPETILYLEGSDQHRGWFQTSLIPSVALRGKAPYDVVLTHGFVNDGKGHKMSKSLGNVVVPQEVIKKYGADVLRLWVAASDYREDVRVSEDIIKHVIDIYRRFRNTFRFLLQNTSDFRFSENKISVDKMQEVDRWMMVHFEQIKTRVLAAYEAYEFHGVLNEMNRFLSVTLSGFYLDALKDCLYCEEPNSPARRSAQTALYHLTRGLAVLVAPLLSFTSEETYLELRKVSDPSLPESVFLDEIKSLTSVAYDAALDDKWQKIFEVRSAINDELDRQRKAGVLKSSQEAAVHLNPDKLPEAQRALVKDPKIDWNFVLQMAEVATNGGDAPVSLKPTSFKKCERCWRHRPDVGVDKNHPTLCGRCSNVVNRSVPA